MRISSDVVKSADTPATLSTASPSRAWISYPDDTPSIQGTSAAATDLPVGDVVVSVRDSADAGTGSRFDGHFGAHNAIALVV